MSKAMSKRATPEDRPIAHTGNTTLESKLVAKQDVAPKFETRPPWQAKQLVEPLPGAKKPGEHGIHEETAIKLEDVPGGHNVQSGEPSTEKVPTGQLAQVMLLGSE
jgi:hypothetical protein